MSRTVATCLLCCALVWSFSATPLFAGVGVMPTRLELRLQDGEKLEGTWTVVNDSEKGIIVDVVVEDWLYAGPKSKRNPTQWLDIESYHFTLEPQSQKEIGYAITTPQDLKSEAAAMVFFTSTDADGPPAMVKPRFGVIVYVAPKGKEKLAATIETVKLKAFKTNEQRESGSEKSNIRAEITVRNNGNVHIRPQGDVTIKPAWGRKIARAEIPYGWVAQQRREGFCVTVIPDVPLKGGSYRAYVNLQFGTAYGQDKRIKKKILFSVDKNGRIHMR